MVQMDFQCLHHVLVLEFLEFCLEIFPKFVHLWVDVVYMSFFEHQ